MTTAGIIASAFPRRTYAVALAEPATAVDSVLWGTGIPALVDSPASALDVIDAFVGEIMIEAASAAATFTADAIRNAAVVEEAAALAVYSVPMTYNVSVTEPAVARDATHDVSPITFTVSILETAPANAVQDSGSPTTGLAGTAVVSGLEPTFVSASTETHRLNSGTMVTLLGAPTASYGTPAVFESVAASSTQDATVGYSPTGPDMQLSFEGDRTPWFIIIGAAPIYVSGIWSGAIPVEMGQETSPGVITSVGDSGLIITTNGYHYIARSLIWVRLRMTSYVSGTAVITGPVP